MASRLLHRLLPAILTGAAIAAAPALADEHDDERGPVEYVRVCDAFGSGYFYIPGTETCLRIGGSVRYSALEHASETGGGTVVRLGTEGFIVRPPDWIHRVGGSIDWDYVLDRDSLGGDWFQNSHTRLFGEFAYAAGRARVSDSAVVGVGGVTQVGLTYGTPQGPSTAIGSSFAGDGVDAWSTYENSWYRFLGGFSASTPLSQNGADPSGIVYVTPRFGGFVEHLDFSSSGRAEITRGGMPLAGFYQDHASSSQDGYAGAVIGADLQYYVSPRMRLSVGGDLLPAYHWGDAAIDITTGTGGGVVPEHYEYDDSGFTLGVSARAGVEFALGDRWSAALTYQWSLLPEVTTIRQPAGPAFQPITFDNRSIQRHEVMVRFQRSFGY